MNSTHFYQLEEEQLEILCGYVTQNSSRNTPFEIIDYCIDILLCVKKQIIDLSAAFLSLQSTNTSNLSAYSYY